MENNNKTYNPRLRIGVLALQGDFEAHLKALREAGATLGREIEAKAIRLPAQLEDLDGIILPGGESTTIGKLMVMYGLLEPLKRKLQEGFPTWGTCAGLILLAKETDNALEGQPLLACMDIGVREGPLLGTAFHAEVSGDSRFHHYFLRLVESVKSQM